MERRAGVVCTVRTPKALAVSRGTGVVGIAHTTKKRPGESMAKLIAPLLAFKAIGTIASQLTFVVNRQVNIAKRKPIPADPRTPGQIAQRDKVADCATQWQALTPSEKQDYIDQAKGARQTAFSLFLVACLQAPPALATLHGTFPGISAPGSNVIVRLFTPTTQTEIYKAIAPTDASGIFDITTIPPGTYDVGIKCDNSVSELVVNKTFIASQTTNVIFPSARRGDLNNDDAVTGTDFSILSGQFGQVGACIGYPGNWLMP